LIEMRIEEERRLGRQQEVRRLEREWLQKKLLSEQTEALRAE